MEEDLLAVHQRHPRRRVQPFREADARIAAADHHYVAVTHAESPVPWGVEGTSISAVGPLSAVRIADERSL
ncbi:hypothetical protein ALMP_83480 [Streptomyces sp. A012304]|nr:hypothetical protein ALMP_83480 [Streptomyces sp. A012304]